MPLLYRNVVPDVPAWTAGNGRLVYRGSNLSRQARMTVAMRVSGEVTMSGAIADAGISGTLVDFTLAGPLPTYGSGQIVSRRSEDVAFKCVLSEPPASQQSSPSGGVQHNQAPTPTFDSRGVFIPIGNSTRPVYAAWGKVFDPSGFESREADVSVGLDTYLVFFPGMAVGHSWDAAHSASRWYAWPSGGIVISDDVINDSDFIEVHGAGWPRWGEGAVPEPLNSVHDICVVQSCRWYDQNEIPRFGKYVYVGGSAIASSDSITYEADELWPRDGMRPGTQGFTLYRNAGESLFNIDEVNLEIELKVSYESPVAPPSGGNNP